MNLKKFFSELKRRNVYKVALTYSITAWLVVEIAGLAANSFNAPDWVMKMIIVVLFLGFPIAIILAWAFEMSPQGIIRTTSDSAIENPNSSKQKKSFIGKLIIGILLLALMGQFIFNKYYQKGSFDPSNIRKSIAVLPFRNDSPNQENLYFCNGIMEGILNHLSKIPELTVISRTSVEQYRENPPSLKKVAEELRVNYLVEGSVQRIGNQVVIFAQLIYAKDDKHVWSQRYEEDVTELFAVQADVTESIADKLEAIISPKLKKLIEDIPTKNPLAYDYYLQGNEYHNMANVRTQKNEEWNKLLDKATLSFEMAIEKDSLFALAYIGIAWVEYERHVNSDKVEQNHLNQMLLLANKAIGIDPNIIEGYWIKGWYYYERDQKNSARKEFEKSLELAPNKRDALFIQFFIIMQGDLDFLRSVRILKKIERISISDDELIELYGAYVDFYYMLDHHEKEEYYRRKLNFLDVENELTTWWLELRKGRIDEAINVAEKKYPENNQTRNAILGNLYYFKGDIEKALEYLEEWYGLIKKESVQDYFSSRHLHRYGQVLILSGQEEKGLKMVKIHIENLEKLDKINQSDMGHIYDLIGIYSVLKQKEKAHFWMEKFDSEKGWLQWGSLYSFSQIDPQFNNIRDDQRFKDWVGNGERQLDSIRNEVREYLASEQ